MGEQLVALAMADDWANEHAETSPSKIQRWARSPATDKQRELLKLAFLDQTSLYEAMCLGLEHAKHRETA
jgi:hypothetical protein